MSDRIGQENKTLALGLKLLPFTISVSALPSIAHQEKYTLGDIANILFSGAEETVQWRNHLVHKHEEDHSLDPQDPPKS